MAKIESLPLNVVWNLTKHELMVACGTINVEIVGVGYADEYDVSDNVEDYPILVNALIIGAKRTEDSGLHHWLMIWNENECDFHTIMSLDQKESNNKDNNNN